MDALLSIGRFGRLCGLSVGALRHYDELGLLAPARIDPDTGYRLYRRDQADAARLIARLRDLDLPLPEIALVLRAPIAEHPALLARARDRTRARLARAQRQLHHLNRIIEHREPIVTMATTPSSVDGADLHRQLAVDLFNHVWTLLETENRSPAQDDEMVHAAHASRHHWGAAGRHREPYRLVAGEWQCARVYAVLGRPEPACWHAARSLALCEEAGITNFFLGAAHEAMARALLVARDADAARAHIEEARRIAAEMEDEEDREILVNDLDSLAELRAS
ncbi:MAG: MerR family transcriptional regulator [Chloroflexota bacterium]